MEDVVADGGFSLECKVTVLDSRKINKEKLTLNIGEQGQLSVHNVNKNQINWTSSDDSVVSVSNTGTVTAEKAGKATITADCGDRKFECKITVIGKVPELNMSEKSIGVDKSFNLSIQTIDGENSDIVWKIGKKSILKKVKVYNSGTKIKLKGLKTGTTTVTATVNGQTMKCKVTVKK